MGRQGHRFASAALVFAPAVALALACTDVTGLSGGVPPDAAPADATTTTEAGQEDAGCPQVAIDETFAAGIGAWIATATGAPAPAVAPDGGVLLLEQQQQAKATLYYPTVVPLHGFDADFDFEVVCPA